MLALVITELALQTSHAHALYREVRRRPPHPFLQVVPAGQVDHVNGEGFRGDPVELTAQAGTFRIFTIGGSTTLGISNPYHESYPFLLETSRPGVFAVGDVRSGSMKRVASAVGEGSTAIALIHQVLRA